MLQVCLELKQVYPQYAKEHWTGCEGKESDFKVRLYRHMGNILTDRFSPDVLHLPSIILACISSQLFYQ